MLEQAGIGHLLRPGDTVHFQGIVRLMKRGMLESGPLQLVITQDRFVCAPAKAGGAPIDIPRSNIASIHQRGGVFGRGVVVIDTTMGRLRLGGLDLQSGAALIAALHTTSGGTAMTRAIATASTGSSIDNQHLIDRIEELESAVDRLAGQVSFLEELLRTRATSARS